VVTMFGRIALATFETRRAISILRQDNQE